MYKAVDLFAGCGGFSLGFAQAGFEVTHAVEFDETIGATYTANFPTTTLMVDDIQTIDEHCSFAGLSADIVIGGPPCQGFSMAGARIRGGFTDDPRNYLFKHYLNIVKELQPRVFVMENVKGMRSMQGGAVFEEIIGAFQSGENFDGHPYSVDWRMLQASDYGVPQSRQRLFIFGVQGSQIDLDCAWKNARDRVEEERPGFFEYVDLRSAIGDLPSPTPDGQINAPRPLSPYQRTLASNSDTVSNHRASRHSAVALRRMKQVKPGENYEVLKEYISSVHSGSYGRLRWNDLASTITTRFDTPAGGRFTHPEQDRTLTPREAARVQSFPDDYVFTGDNRSISRQIGNAVPPKLAYFVAEVAKQLLS